MSLPADVIACARIVERGDPDRFAATMAAPVAARAVLFPIYAFNVEVARAPWVTAEPLIAEIRLQWWADALDEIASGSKSGAKSSANVRAHEVTTPLARVLDAEGAGILMASVDARRRDAQRLPMAQVAELQSYVAETGGALMWAAARALGSDQETRARAIGTAAGLANYQLAVPAFLARGINPLPEMTEAEFAALLAPQIAALHGPRPDPALRIAALSAWRAGSTLRRARRDPAAAPQGRLSEPEALSRLRLMWRAARV